MMRFGGKLAVVTGAASGIGLTTAELLVAEGAFVIGTDRHDQHAATWGPALGGRGLFLRHDVRDALDWRHVMQTALGRYGRLDVLVNAAGVNGVLADGTPPQQVHDMDDSIWAFVNGVNAEGVMLGCRFALQAMRARGGAIVNISSISAVRHNLRPFIAYYTSKAGILGFTRGVALDHAKSRIRCNAILPGMMNTPMMIEPAKARMSQAEMVVWMKERDAKVPYGRAGTGWDVARAALFFASDDSDYITGQTLVVDGGVTSKFM